MAEITQQTAEKLMNTADEYAELERSLRLAGWTHAAHGIDQISKRLAEIAGEMLFHFTGNFKG